MKIIYFLTTLFFSFAFMATKTNNNENQNFLTQLQHLQTESKIILKEWQRAKIKEKLFMEMPNMYQSLQEKAKTDTQKKIVELTNKISKGITDQNKKAVMQIITSNNFKKEIDNLTNTELEKIVNQNKSFNEIKQENNLLSTFPIPSTEKNKILSQLFMVLANTRHYELLWQKIMSKEKSIAAKITVVQTSQETQSQEEVPTQDNSIKTPNKDTVIQLKTARPKMKIM